MFPSLQTSFFVTKGYFMSSVLAFFCWCIMTPYFLNRILHFPSVFLNRSVLHSIWKVFPRYGERNTCRCQDSHQIWSSITMVVKQGWLLQRSCRGRFYQCSHMYCALWLILRHFWTLFLMMFVETEFLVSGFLFVFISSIETNYYRSKQYYYLITFLK